MATRDELYKRAKEENVDVKSSAKKAEIEKALDKAGVSLGEQKEQKSESKRDNKRQNKQEKQESKKSSTNVEDVQPVDEVVANQNEGGEATHGTTLDGNEKEVKNTTSIPQNGQTEIQTFGDPQPEDEARTESEVRYADEANPNQKARKYVPGEVDEDGNTRTGGKSYGVSSNDPTVTDKENPNG